MQNAVAPLRAAEIRKRFEKAVDKYEPNIVPLDSQAQPRLWQIARLGPDIGLDSAGNAARMGRAVLLNLRSEGLTVDNIFDPNQEVRFHDVRKALRSVLVLVDMFPSLSAAVADVRNPLSDVVKAYGKANDQVVAYHEAKLDGRPLDQRASELSDAFNKAQERARKFADSGQLDAYADALAAAADTHRR
jgi:hypothetical protein